MFSSDSRLHTTWLSGRHGCAGQPGSYAQPSRARSLDAPLGAAQSTTLASCAVWPESSPPPRSWSPTWSVACGPAGSTRDCGRADASPRCRTCRGTPPPWRPTALPIDHSRPPPISWRHDRAPGRPGRRSPRKRACASGHLVRTHLLLVAHGSCALPGTDRGSRPSACCRRASRCFAHLKSAPRTIQGLSSIHS